MLAFLLSVHIATVPGAVEAMNFIKEDIKPVIQYSMDWAMKAALAATSTHAFIVLAKRFLD
ncbi:MAG: hypothetical protein JGK17_30870 [Microcoleus sp. PH2017_10_PVI_O_A]|uniref:hypothetical protein n=1 Tax=unclassified Microcoleus TaxID=2642155 RepID=UPI001DE18DCD|nr:MULTISPECIES: hypothetical protein [unclassified Microcoleus]TAE78794.1 MAG: hypothetical protein EAZ83_23925 [Oscillatoriales cyanobacterium]MCC3409867.1 hypothetical protein [Microcoleus sp. PH2017_10_PVI_O_A]MCC3460003.1 hypothetical protein [Microcoleus sp. PH2017_11_PCY_U_A]MCC3482466.1 hypothetical protein [Microcoleus sp. PH2017_12_PCY_D_A]MCC3531106.1 hypothetical protein [Microcoleus sp. PH2017_21_RUC_O_A]